MADPAQRGMAVLCAACGDVTNAARIVGSDATPAGVTVRCDACINDPARGARVRRKATAYVRFLMLDVHRAEAGRLMLALESRFQAFAVREEPVGSPGAVGLARRRLRALYRTSRLRAPLEAARSRWDALARLCQRAREIAKRLGCFDVAQEAGT